MTKDKDRVNDLVMLAQLLLLGVKVQGLELLTPLPVDLKALLSDTKVSERIFKKDDLFNSFGILRNTAVGVDNKFHLTWVSELLDIWSCSLDTADVVSDLFLNMLAIYVKAELPSPSDSCKYDLSGKYISDILVSVHAEMKTVQSIGISDIDSDNASVIFYSTSYLYHCAMLEKEPYLESDCRMEFARRVEDSFHVRVQDLTIEDAPIEAYMYKVSVADFRKALLAVSVLLLKISGHIITLPARFSGIEREQSKYEAEKEIDQAAVTKVAGIDII